MTTWQLDIHTGVRAARVHVTRFDMHDTEFDDLDLDELFEICNSEWSTASASDSWQSRLYRIWDETMPPSMSVGDFVVCTNGDTVRQMAIVLEIGWRYGTYTVVGAS